MAVLYLRGVVMSICSAHQYHSVVNATRWCFQLVSAFKGTLRGPVFIFFIHFFENGGCNDVPDK